MDEKIPSNLIPAIVDVFRDGKNIYGSVYKTPLSWLSKKLLNSGIPEEYAEKVIEIIYMTDNLNPSLEEITAEISKISE